ncbi:response regulator [Mesorhizobium sp. SP-1A]|uniref:response regulator n=1 Tax=Mesorhizobium sp. SP-1A TaxID=3077840 RepID=UPI0028F74DA7|nr:response regulator [Mesorhizobium sp. SP-1A]
MRQVETGVSHMSPLPEESALPLEGVRIVVLEDEYLIAMDVEQLCRDNGAEDVTIVQNLSEIEADSLGKHFDAAIVDMMLNGESTLEFSRRLLALGMPFVIASGYLTTEEIGALLPGVGFVEKPYAGNDLVEALAQALRRGSAAD